MTSTTVYKYKVYCIAEAIDVELWSTTTPTLCPNDHPVRTIDPSRTRIVDSLSTDIVKIEESTNGVFRHEITELTIPVQAPGTVNTFNFVNPADREVWQTYVIPQTANIGDVFESIVGPNSVIGLLTQNLNIGETNIYLSPAFFSTEFAIKGTYINVTDGVNLNEMGRVSNVDKVNFKITCETAATNNFVIGAFVRMNLYNIKNMILYAPNVLLPIGSKGVKARLIPTGTVTRVLYKNNDGLAKKFYIHSEYYYL